jgi:hypothetical protein
LEKQVNAQLSQDNRRNMVNKVEKGKTVPKFTQQQKKAIHHKKVERASIDEKIEYARSVFLNARRSHIKNGIGYKSGDKYISRINSMVKSSSSSPRATLSKIRSKVSTTLTIFLILMRHIFLICLTMILMDPMFL